MAGFTNGEVEIAFDYYDDQKRIFKLMNETTELL